MSPDREDSRKPQRRSSHAEAAAMRWTDAQDDDAFEPAPPLRVPQSAEGVPNRHSASAEAAALRWREYEEEEEPPRPRRGRRPRWND